MVLYGNYPRGRDRLAPNALARRESERSTRERFFPVERSTCKRAAAEGGARFQAAQSGCGAGRGRNRGRRGESRSRRAHGRDGRVHPDRCVDGRLDLAPPGESRRAARDRRRSPVEARSAATRGGPRRASLTAPRPPWGPLPAPCGGAAGPSGGETNSMNPPPYRRVCDGSRPVAVASRTRPRSGAACRPGRWCSPGGPRVASARPRDLDARVRGA